MNRDDAIRMARKIWGEQAILPFDDLERFAAEVAAAERESVIPVVYGNCESDNAAQRIVDAIRARSQS